MLPETWKHIDLTEEDIYYTNLCRRTTHVYMEQAILIGIGTPQCEYSEKYKKYYFCTTDVEFTHNACDGIYFLTCQGMHSYIGLTRCSVKMRVDSHKKCMPFDSIYFLPVDVEEYDLESCERDYIHCFCPAFNKASTTENYLQYQNDDFKFWQSQFIHKINQLNNGHLNRRRIETLERFKDTWLDVEITENFLTKSDIPHADTRYIL